MPRAGLIRCALVVAGAEGAPGAGEDDHADGAVGIGPVEDPMQLGFELVRECVHALGPIERDGHDAFLDAVKDLLAHPSSFHCCGRPWGWSPAAQYASPVQGEGTYVDTTIAARGTRRRRALSEAHEWEPRAEFTRLRQQGSYQTALVVFFSAISQCRAALFD